LCEKKIGVFMRVTHNFVKNLTILEDLRFGCGSAAIGFGLLFFTLINVSFSVAQQPETPDADAARSIDAAADADGDASPSDSVSVRRHRHPWGRFAPGAWSLVRVVNEKLENGEIVSTGMTETLTTLMNVEDDGVTLQYETVAWVSGKRLEANPQTVKQCFHGGLCGEIKVTPLPPVKINIDGQDIECNVESAQMVDGNIRTTIRSYYNDTLAPFVFKRESETVNLEKKTTVSEMAIQVDALAMPCGVLDEIVSASHFRIVRETAGGDRTTTLTYMSTEIPGGTIRHSSKEVDPNGRVVSRSILELTDFGTETENKRIGIFKRRAKSERIRGNGRRSVERLAE